MIIGVGIDIADCKRFRRTIERLGEHFINRVYTAAEVEYCLSRRDPYPSFATIFAVKEAVMKALGYGLDDGASFGEIETLITGRLEIRLSGKTLAKARELGVERVFASFSYERDKVCAAVIAAGPCGESPGFIPGLVD